MEPIICLITLSWDMGPFSLTMFSYLSWKCNKLTLYEICIIIPVIPCHNPRCFSCLVNESSQFLWRIFHSLLTFVPQAMTTQVKSNYQHIQDDGLMTISLQRLTLEIRHLPDMSKFDVHLM